MQLREGIDEGYSQREGPDAAKLWPTRCVKPNEKLFTLCSDRSEGFKLRL